MIHRQAGFWFLTLLFTASLVACSGNGKKWNPDDYTVKSGDTVYSIAWRYELDPEAFAAWNNLNSSRLIKPGQRLHTRKPWNFDSTRKKPPRSANSTQSAKVEQPVAKVYSNEKWVKAEKGDSLYALSRRYGVSIERLAQLNQLKKPYVIQPGQTIFLQPLNPASNKKPAVARSSVVRPQPPEETRQTRTAAINWPKTVKWQRPANGQIIKRFNRQRNDSKGIDIAGKQGDKVVAAAGGKVVYSGDGLISYGRLIIIKHNNSFLSAYAYNHKLLVKEGDEVKRGQQIAEMGRKDKLSPRLHFEIRKNGKPVDPLKYLPY